MVVPEPFPDEIDVLRAELRDARDEVRMLRELVAKVGGWAGLANSLLMMIEDRAKEVES